MYILETLDKLDEYGKSEENRLKQTNLFIYSSLFNDFYRVHHSQKKIEWNLFIFGDRSTLSGFQIFLVIKVFF